MEFSNFYDEFIRPFWIVWLAVLVVMVFWYAFNPKNKEKFDEHAKSIFKDDENGG